MSQTPTQTQVPDELKSLVNEKELLVWQKDTWGTRGQHDNLYTFIIDLEKLEQQPIFKLITTRHENRDSRKNIHRFTYVKLSDIKKLQGKVLKIVHDYASSSNRTVTVKYYYVSDKLEKLESESGLRDEQGFFDRVKLPDSRILIVRKNSVQIQN